MRQRTTKGLARRIELDHWRRPHPLRAWVRRSWYAGLCAAGLWMGAAALRGDQTIWRPGPVSTRHAIFGDDCARCHEPWRAVADGACLACHDGPPHSERAAERPACASCHEEHRGAAALAPSVPDAHCTRCHADLAVADGKPLSIASGIAAFGEGHPEFAAVRAGAVDPGDIRFNHLLHLRANLEGERAGPDGARRRETLACTSCHAPDASRALMTPPRYEKACARCHPLDFDASRFPDEVVPHAEPALVRGFLRERYTAWVAAHPEALRAGEGGGRRRRPGAAPAEAAGGDEEERAAAWVARAVAAAEGPLYVREGAAPPSGERVERCSRCHTVGEPEAPGGPPAVAPPDLRGTWMPRARFDHETHRALACAACHERAPRSETARDVLLPGIATCRACHHEGRGASRSTCVTCHVHHDRAKQRDLDGRLAIPDLATGRRRSP
jgi:hypothetical protein